MSFTSFAICIADGFSSSNTCAISSANSLASLFCCAFSITSGVAWNLTGLDLLDPIPTLLIPPKIIRRLN